MGSPPPIQLATLSMWDTLLLMALALVVFGPRRLPKIGRQLGKLMYEFRKASNDFKFQMEEELRNAEEADRRKKEEEQRQRTLAAPPPPSQLEAAASQDSTAPSTVEEPGAPASMQTPDAAGTIGPSVEAGAAPSNERFQPVVESSAPRILPPSTGETVAAAHPGKAAKSVAPEDERSEPAAHHG